jgi:hypothetical protein
MLCGSVTTITGTEDALMKSLLCSLGLLLLSTLAAYSADEKLAKPNALTPKEIADGWILLFDGESTFGCSVEGEAKVENGMLVVGGEKQATIPIGFGFFESSWQYRWEGNDAPEVGVRLFGKQGTSRFTNSMKLAPITGEQWNTARFQINPSLGPGGGGRSGRKEIAGPFVDTLTVTIPPPRGRGRFEVQIHVPEKSRLLLRNLKVKPLGLSPIFNGKDLTGWKEIHTDRTKSKFGVNDKGELIIKNGPGDIQSEGQWDDFVLQIDVLSNGPHLNSGVFFRCLPGQFWAGYEAQIRNEWISDVTLKDGTKLSGSLTLKDDDAALQVYTVQGKQARPARPRQMKKFAKADITELVDHRDMPIDFGTGAIYNQQPARKVVSNDHEWYTMTIVANGNHLAVWVNGYQTADFTDKRPPNESARKGAKVDKGPVSLQGHDPTTDLCFKNIRIAELPK